MKRKQNRLVLLSLLLIIIWAAVASSCEQSPRTIGGYAPEPESITDDTSGFVRVGPTGGVSMVGGPFDYTIRVVNTSMGKTGGGWTNHWIDLPEEYVAVSPDSLNPSLFSAFQRGDTIFMRFYY